eukprot:206386_1
MALQQIDTHECVGEEQGIDVWLQQNKLMKARDKLIENDVTLDELKELADESSTDELKIYAQKELDLDILTAKRFAKSVSSLSSTHMTPKRCLEPTTPVDMLITKEEQNALNNITQKRKYIISKISELLHDINTLQPTSKSNTDHLNQFRNNIIIHLNRRIDELIVKSDQIIAQKKQMVTDQIISLQNTNKSLDLLELKSKEFLQNSTININTRQNRIINLAQGALILTSQIEEFDIRPKVTVKLEKPLSQIVAFINNMIDIDDHDVPLIPDITVSDIKKTSATVTINNMKTSWECSLAMCRNYNHLRQDHNQWKHLNSIQHKNNYSITTLENDTNYGLSARYKNKRRKYGEWCKPIVFKTMLGIPIWIQYSVSGYIRQCQALFLSHGSYFNMNILIHLVMSYFDDSDEDCFDINHDTVFNYKYDENGNKYHVFGTKEIKRECMDKYKWTIETNQLYKGVFGIVDITGNVSSKINNKFKQGSYIYNHKDVLTVGTKLGNCGGYRFGKRDNKSRSFIQNGDIVSIVLDFMKNTICFESNKADRKVVMKLRDGVEIVRFIAEFYDNDATIKLV